MSLLGPYRTPAEPEEIVEVIDHGGWLEIREKFPTPPPRPLAASLADIKPWCAQCQKHVETARWDSDIITGDLHRFVRCHGADERKEFSQTYLYSLSLGGWALVLGVAFAKVPPMIQEAT